MKGLAGSGERSSSDAATQQAAMTPNTAKMTAKIRGDKISSNMIKHLSVFLFLYPVYRAGLQKTVSRRCGM